MTSWLLPGYKINGNTILTTGNATTKNRQAFVILVDKKNLSQSTVGDEKQSGRVQQNDKQTCICIICVSDLLNLVVMGSISFTLLF